METFATKQPSKDASQRQSAAAKAVPVGQRRNFSSLSTDIVLLQRKPACACGGGCPRCQAERDLEEIIPIQTKLKISQPGDKYEQEADRIANRVLQQKSLSGEVEYKTNIRPKLSQQAEKGELEINEDLEARLNHSQGGGNPLSKKVRAFFEPLFQHDFSEVRVHTDNEASQMNQELGARAFTYKQNIYFQDSQYNPHSIEGKRLLAHELTHVVQQTGNTPSVLNTVQRDESPEEMANRPHIAMERWSQLNATNRTAVLSLMRQRYGETFAIRFEQAAQQMRLPFSLHMRNFVRSRETMLRTGWEMIGVIDNTIEFWVHIAGHVLYLISESAPEPEPEPPRQQRPPERLSDIDFGDIVQESLETHVFVIDEDEPYVSGAGTARRYQDGTIEFCPFGREGCWTYRPVPGSPGFYAVYHSSGRLMEDPLGLLDDGIQVELNLARIFH